MAIRLLPLCRTPPFTIRNVVIIKKPYQIIIIEQRLALSFRRLRAVRGILNDGMIPRSSRRRLLAVVRI